MALFKSITEAEWVYVRDDMSKGLKIIETNIYKQIVQRSTTCPKSH